MVEQPPHSEASQLGPSIWAVSDGRAGNAAQVLSVMQALGSTQRWMQIAHIQGKGHSNTPIELSPRAPWTWLPGGNWPWALRALPEEQRNLFTPPWPDVWIAAGRRSAPYTHAMRQLSGGRTLCVQILNPRTDPTKFDIIVTPEHDGLSAPNVISTVGSPSHFATEDIETAGQAFADLADEPSKSCIVVLGGDSKTHKFTEMMARTLIAQMKALSREGWRLRITASRRTPVPVIARMRAFADETGARFWAGPEDGPNPYLAWLLYSDAAIVTEDSANMLSDAAWHGLPVHIARLEGSAAKFDRLHNSLIQRGCARWFDGKLEQWRYEPLREAGRVADAIIQRMLKRHPQPAMKSIEDQSVVIPDWLK